MPLLFIDSVNNLTPLITLVQNAVNRNVDGVVLYIGGKWSATKDMVAGFHNLGYHEMFCYPLATATDVAGSYATGYSHAQNSIALAEAIGVPYSCTIFLDIEYSYLPSVDFLCGWADGQRDGPYCKAGGLYASPGSSALQSALAGARAKNSNCQLIVMWAASWLYGSNSQTISIPEWYPPKFGQAITVAWQYVGDWQGTDCDLIDDNFEGIWRAPRMGFSDVPQDYWAAQQISQAAQLGLIHGYPDGTFKPENTLTRAEAAVIALNTYNAGRTPVSTMASKNTSRKYGAIPSHPKPGLPSHKIWTSIGDTTLPSSYIDQIVDSWLPVEDQSQSSMCVAFSASEVRRWWIQKLVNDANLAVMLSAPYIYARGHEIAGDTGEGMQPLWALECLTQYGVCPWDADPLNPLTETEQQAVSQSPASLDVQAVHYKINAYAPVDPTKFDDMRQAIFHAPILISIPCYYSGGIESPTQYNGDWYINPPASGAQVMGGHEIVAYGWNIDQQGNQWYRIRNSWGSGWGKNGSAWLSAKHPIWEAWSMTCALSADCIKMKQAISDCQTFLQQFPNIRPEEIAALKTYISGLQTKFNQDCG